MQQVWLVTDIAGKTQPSEDSIKQNQHQVFANKMSLKIHQRKEEVIWTALTEALEEISNVQRNIKVLS